MLIIDWLISICENSGPGRRNLLIFSRRVGVMVFATWCIVSFPLFGQEASNPATRTEESQKPESEPAGDVKSDSSSERQSLVEKAMEEEQSKSSRKTVGDSPGKESAGRKARSLDKPPVAGLTYSDPVTSRYKVGVKIKATAAMQNVYLAIPVPRDWPEQAVIVDSEEMPPAVGDVSFAEIEGGVRRQIIKIPHLKSDEEIEISTILRVESSQINLTPEARGFLRPKANHKDGKPFLNPTPHISFMDTKLRNRVKELTRNKNDVWGEVESLYDWVRDNVDQKEMPNTDSVKAFRKKEGSEEDRVALFIAFCRCHKIPARTVWVDGSSYAEFMLVDERDNACWFPCNIAGVREFGFVSEPRVILQKGENIKIPEKDERQRFVAEHMRGQGSPQPTVKFVRELLPAN